MNFALSKQFLPDELVTWIFHSGTLQDVRSRLGLILTVLFLVPAEPRDELRQVYCRVFKVGSKITHTFQSYRQSLTYFGQHATAERVRSLIRPDDIDLLFERLGATPKALAFREPVSPDPRKI